MLTASPTFFIYFPQVIFKHSENPSLLFKRERSPNLTKKGGMRFFIEWEVEKKGESSKKVKK